METTIEECDQLPLDESCFKHFAPLLHASQRYAQLSGCRFRAKSFDNLPDEPPCISEGTEVLTDPRVAAKIFACPKVSEFAERLKGGEDGLVDELDRAFRITMVESVRNAMISMFKALDMFPPEHPPPGVDSKDCAYEDVSAPLPCIAQRLFNDQVRRETDGAVAGRLQRRAMTAAFIVDFATVHGVPLPPIPETQHSMLSDFSAHVTEETKRSGIAEAQQMNARTAFLEGLGVSSVAVEIRQSAGKWWAEHWMSFVYTALRAAIVVVDFGPVGAPGCRLEHRLGHDAARHLSPMSAWRGAASSVPSLVSMSSSSS